MEVNYRFSISSCLSESTHQILEKTYNHDFHKLVKKSQQSLQDRLNNKDLQEVFKNKSISMLFLDKTSSLIGKHHPDSLEVKKFMGGPSSYPSLELIHRLTQLLDDPHLSQEMILNLRKWITEEQDCLLICLIFDAWGATNEESVMRATTKGVFPDIPITHKIQPPKDEVDIFSHALAAKMQSMKAGDRFKIPAGAVNHVTRLEFIKKDNGSFDIIHFNTGYGVIEIKGRDSTACQYRDVPQDKLETPLFWTQLVEAKMQASMTPLNDLLKNLNPERHPKDIISWLKKPLQGSGSCSFHAAQAEFKHSFITSFPSLEKGWEAYKLCTSLMILNATSSDLDLEPSIAKMLHIKAKIRSRYLDWMTLLDQPEKLESVQNAYISAIASMGRHPPKSSEALIEFLPPIMALSVLDKRLNDGLDSASFAELNYIRNTYGPAVTFDDFNHMGYKQLKWLESTREVLHDASEFTGWKGDLVLNIRGLSKILLPLKWNNELQTKLNYAILDKKTLSPLLTEYILRENPEICDHTLKNLVDEHFLYDSAVIYAHIKKCLKADPKKALELIQKPMDEDSAKKILKKTYPKLLVEGHTKTAIEMTGLLEGLEKNIALVEIAVFHAMKGELDDAMAYTELTAPSIVLSITKKLCDVGMMTLALRFASQLQDEDNRLKSLRLISFELIKIGKAKMAMNALQMIPYTDLAEIINFNVYLLCRENLVNDAILFVSHIPTYFYQDVSHMIVKSAFECIIDNLHKASSFHDENRILSRLPQGPLKESLIKHAHDTQRAVVNSSPSERATSTQQQLLL